MKVLALGLKVKITCCCYLVLFLVPFKPISNQLNHIIDNFISDSFRSRAG